MAHETERASPLASLVQRVTIWNTAAVVENEELEQRIDEEAQQGNWEEVLRLLQLTEKNVSRESAADCLIRAIHTASAQQFTAILEQMPEVEYAGCAIYGVSWIPLDQMERHLKWVVNVAGTLVMHAVASNRTDLLRILLDRGCDVNCVSPAAATAPPPEPLTGPSVCPLTRGALPAEETGASLAERRRTPL